MRRRRAHAYFVSYLSAAGEEAARERFLHACDGLAPVGSETLLFEAASLLRWSSLPFRELQPDWPTAVERRVELTRTRLAAYERARSRRRPERQRARRL